MNSIEWIAGCVLNGPLPIYEAVERLKSRTTCVISQIDMEEMLEAKLARKASRISGTSEEDKAYILAHYPTTRADTIAEHLDMSVDTVRGIAKRAGVKKDLQTLRDIRRQSGQGSKA